MDLQVRGKGYILVGASRGMGYEVAKILAADGANIAIISRGDSGNEAARTLAADYGVQAIALQADATVPGSVEGAIDKAVEALGDVRGLLAAAAERKYGGLIDTTDEDWDRCFQSVVMGTVRPLRAIVPHLIDAGGGCIVTMGAYSAKGGKPYTFAYSSAKAMVANITKNLARTYGEFNIRANCVCPGTIETERTRGRVDKIVAEQGVSREAAALQDLANLNMPVALQRVAQPEEPARMIAFLLSEANTYATGALVNVDGGTDF